MTTWVDKKWNAIDADTKVEILLGVLMLTIGVELGRAMESGQWSGFWWAVSGCCLGVGLSKWRLKGRKGRGSNSEAPP